MPDDALIPEPGISSVPDVPDELDRPRIGVDEWGAAAEGSRALSLSQPRRSSIASSYRDVVRRRAHARDHGHGARIGWRPY